MDIKDVDTDGKATRLASEAQVALETGETTRAQALFEEAGSLLATKIPLLTKPSGRDVCRLLAATQYFKGGLYQKAKKLCDRIEQERLPRRLRSVFQSFKRDLSVRSASEYKKTWAGAFKAAYDQNAWAVMLEMLNDDPFMVSPSYLAYMRARCSENLGNQRAASLFFRRAYEFDEHTKNYRSLYIDSLFKENRDEEARQYIEAEMKKEPDFHIIVDGITALSRAAAANPASSDFNLWRNKQAELFELAAEAYDALPSDEQRKRRDKMNYAFSLALIAQDEAGSEAAKVGLLSRWIAFEPNIAAPLILRGAYTYPLKQAMSDFEMAIHIGTSEALPYFYLAHKALVTGNWQDAVKLSEEGLRRHPTVPGLDQQLLELRAAVVNLLRQEEHATMQTQLREDELQEMGAKLTDVTNSIKISKEYKVEVASSLRSHALQVA